MVFFQFNYAYLHKMASIVVLQNILLIIISMLNQLIDSSEKERRTNRSRIYKKILDQQIQQTQQIRMMQQMENFKQEEENNAKREPIFYERRIKRQLKDINSDLLRLEIKRRLREKKIYLPHLVDRNVKFQGSTNYIAFENHQHHSPFYNKQIKTEHHDPSDCDSKYSTCNKIIEELEQINQKLKHRTNRRNKKRKQHQANVSEAENQHSNLRYRQQRKRQKLLTKSDKLPIYSQLAMTNISSSPKLPEALTTKKIISNPESLPFSKFNNQGTKMPNLNKSQSQKQKNHLKALLSQKRRQNFLQQLRKVRNRGQSLFLKLNRFPVQIMKQ